MSFPSWVSFALLGIVLIQLVAILIFVLFRRRKDGEGTDSPQATPPGGLLDDLKRLKNSLGDKTRKSPLFLVLGDVLPDSIRTVFQGYGGEHIEGTRLDFHLFDRGILVVPKESSEKHGAVSPQVYDELFYGLLQIRPRRPVDGIVLSTSVETIFQADQADRTASRLHHLLVRLQQITGMRLPVHLLFHDSERLVGFTELGCMERKSGQEECDFLAWRPTFRPESAWNSDCLREAFDFFSARLQYSRIRFSSEAEERDAHGSRNLFLLTDELKHLETTLSRFCNHIFTPGVYHEPFLFRGLAFGGTVSGDGKESRFITGHTLLREWLPEAAIHAVPVRRLFQARRRSLRILQAVSISLLILWGLGMFWRLPSLQEETASLCRFSDDWDIVYEYQQAVCNAGKGENVKPPAEFGDVLAETFRLTRKDKGAGLRSLFFPGSYISPLASHVRFFQEDFYNDMTHTLMPCLLKRRADQVYAPLPPESPAPKKLGKLSDELWSTPLETAEYKALEKHVARSVEFCDMYRKYHSLLDNGNPIAFLELTQYLCEVPRSLTLFILDKEKSGLETVLKDVVRNSDENEKEYILAQVWREIPESSQKVFEQLTSRFDHRIYSQNPLLLHLERMEQALNDPDFFEPVSFERDNLESFWRESSLIVIVLKDERYNWILRKTPYYTEIQLPLRDTILEKTPLTRKDIDHWNGRGQKLKQSQFERLEKLSSMRNGAFFSYETPLSLKPMPWIESLSMLLGRLRDEAFMKSVEKAYVSPLAGNPVSVEWDVQALQDALNMADCYGKIFGDFEPPQFETVRSKSRRRLIDNMHKLVADSRCIRRLPAGMDRFPGNFPEASHYILQILELYESFGTDAKRQLNELTKVADEQALALMADYDGQFAVDRLYEPSKPTLDKWNGQGSVLVPLLGIGAEGEVDVYLDLRRQRLKYWTDKINPILNYLAKRSEYAPSDKDSVRIERWKTIRTGIELYDTHASDNPVSALEQFVKNELTDPLHEPRSSSPNWFYQKMYELDAAARNADGKRAELDFFARWNRAADFFNRHLGGRFPFVAERFASAPSASPDAIRAFYDLLPGISTIPTDWVIPNDYREFHRTMNSVRPLFFGKLPGPNTIPDLAVSVRYRFANPSECGCQRLLDQSLQFGGQELSVQSGTSEGVWKFGSPVRFVLQWAKDGGVVPASAPLDRSAEIRANRLVCDYSSPWSLLVFLCENAQPVLEHDPAGDINRSTDVLAFEIATMPSGSNPSSSSGDDMEKLRTFVQVRLHKAEGDAEAEEIVLPRRFPEWMPTEGGTKRFRMTEALPDAKKPPVADPPKENAAEREICPPDIQSPMFEIELSKRRGHKSSVIPLFHGETIVEEKVIYDGPILPSETLSYPVPTLAPSVPEK